MDVCHGVTFAKIAETGRVAIPTMAHTQLYCTMTPSQEINKPQPHQMLKPPLVALQLPSQENMLNVSPIPSLYQYGCVMKITLTLGS